MKVLKFGGTSVGTAQRMKNVCDIVLKERGNIVVLSAMSGTTNALVEIAGYYEKGNPEGAHICINKLKEKYQPEIETLHSSNEYRNKTRQFLDEVFTLLHSFSSKEYCDEVEKTILAQGEIMSTNMVTNYLMEQGYNVKLLYALDFMRLGDNGEPDSGYIRKHLTEST